MATAKGEAPVEVAAAFDWGRVPAPLLTKLAKHTSAARRGVPPEDSLRDRFGVCPDEEFIHEAWPVLRDSWLASRPEPRNAVVTRLRDVGLGDTHGATSTAAAQVAYLKSCRNTARLRRIVLEAFIASATSQPASGKDADASTHPTAAPPVSAGDLATHLSRLGLGEQIRIADGEGTVLASFTALPTGSIEVTLVDDDRKGSAVTVASRAEVAALAQQAVSHLGSVAEPSLTLIDGAGRPRTIGAPSGPPDFAEVGIPGPGGLPLDERVGRFLAQRLGLPYGDLHRDADGDIPFIIGSAAFFVRTVADPPTIVVFSPLLFDVPPSPALSQTLSAWSGHRLLKFRELDGVVTAEIVLPGDPFVGQHLDIAVGTMTAVLDDLDDRLQNAFGGRRGTDREAKPAPQGDARNEGSYL